MAVGRRGSKIQRIWEKRMAWFTSMHSMLLLTIALIFLVSITMGYLVKNYAGMVNKEFHDIYRDSADFYISAVEGKLSSYQTAMGVVAMSNDLRKHIFREDVSRSEMVSLGRDLREKVSEMTFLLYQSHEIISHRLYTYLPSDGNLFWDIKDVEADENFARLKNGSMQWWYTYSNVTHSYHLTLAKTIDNFNSSIGVWGQGVCYQTMLVNATDLYEPNLSLPVRVYLFDNRTGDMIYSNVAPKDRKKLYGRERKNPDSYDKTENGDDLQADLREEWLNEKTSDFRTVSLEQDGKTVKFSALTRQVASVDATAVMLFDTKQIKAAGGTRMIYGIVVVLIAMMLLLILSGWMYNRRLNKLIVHMDQFDEKDNRLPSPIGGVDELARIDRHLRQMQNRIQVLIQEEYTAKMQVMAAQQEALMACINPHFLYNTLNTISVMAGLEDADSTVEMISALSDMFRYSSDLSKQMVTLGDELDNIKDYLYIQSIRYQDAFTWHMDIEESLCCCPVPKLILQPIVENAFKHGFKNQMTGQEEDRQICITAMRSETDLVISVIDNGKGISDERLMSIKNQFSASVSEGAASVMENGSIGLLNVHHRIKLCYGPEYGLELVSEKEGAGLKVLVRIPVG